MTRNALLIFASTPLLLAPLIGCASNSPQREEVAATEYKPADPVAASRLRERFIAVLEAAAVSETALFRANALEALHPTPSRVEPLARVALRDENLGVRYAAAVTIGKLKLAACADDVETLLRDPSKVVRAAAIYALTRLGRPVDQSLLATMLLEGAPRERMQAAFLLGEIGNESAIPMLRDAAENDVPSATVPEMRILRLQIAEALAKLGDPAAFETIRASLFPARPDELESAALAAQIIGEVGDRRAIDQLIYLTAQSGDDRLPAEIRLAAAGSLASLGERNGSFIADEYVDDDLPAIRAQAAYVYGEIGMTENLPRLEQMLSDPAGIVRLAAAAAGLKILEQPHSARSMAGSAGR
ncbi:MAG: HEAT repeat domain-containing protein [Planctomycetota bacterium]|nr:HEAT repeat domain-containing protein [Planctomycetota bacterium]